MSDPTAAAVAPIAVALDTADLDTALRWAHAVAPHVRCLKVGLELFSAHGARAVHAIQDGTGRELFLDLKLHDIPATVAGAARALAPLAPTYLTVHAAGGPAMIASAAEALPDTRIAGVTVLTSLSAGQLDEIGLAGPPVDAVARLARLAAGAGARAIVCSPHEVATVRAALGPEVVLLVPGVRPAGVASNDQARTATPATALADGADLVVIGRPITGADDPGEAAAAIAATLAPAEVA
ncbi:MAG TPA: orotidine-5'-phosphate decarboxylase [Mycobacteriales bacterium]|nr:orotidine-5'-phosphate decarboxylase [Mycobacteriales bacterium]